MHRDQVKVRVELTNYLRCCFGPFDIARTIETVLSIRMGFILIGERPQEYVAI